MNKMLPVFLALLISATMPLAPAWGEQTMFYLLKPDETVEITSYIGKDSELVLPSFRGFPVTSIGYGAFTDCNTLTSVIIPDSITSIGKRAFYSCRSLTSISIPDSVTHIGSDAFAWCTYLTSITLPPHITSISDHLLFECESLTSITIPDGVTSIGNEAFCGCDSLTSITVPDGVTSIGFQAFANTDSLKTVTLPDSVTSIGYGAFSWCGSLSSITLPSGLTAIEKRMFDGCYALTSVTIPDSVISIGDEAFDRCPFLTLTVGCGSYAMQYAIENKLDYVVSHHQLGLDHACLYCDYSLPSPDTGDASIHTDTDGDAMCDLCAADIGDVLRYRYNTMFSMDRFNVPASIFDSSRICKAVFLNARENADMQAAAGDAFVFLFPTAGDELEPIVGDDGTIRYGAGHSAILLIDENGNGLMFEASQLEYDESLLQQSNVTGGLLKMSTLLSARDVGALLKGECTVFRTGTGGRGDRQDWHYSPAYHSSSWDHAVVFVVDAAHGKMMFDEVKRVFEDETGYILTLHDCDHYALAVLLSGLEGFDKASIFLCNSATPNGTYEKIESYVTHRDADHMYVHDWK